MTFEQKLNAIQAAEAAKLAAVTNLGVKADATDDVLAEGEAVLDGRAGMVYTVAGGKVVTLGPYVIKGVIPPVA